MNFEDRGGARRLKKLLANPERAERVTQIRQQMRAAELRSDVAHREPSELREQVHTDKDEHAGD